MSVHRRRTPPYQAERRDESNHLPPAQYIFIVAQNNSSFFISITPTTCLTYIHMKLCPDSHVTYHHRLLLTDLLYVQTNAQTSAGFTDSTVEQRDQLNTTVEPQDQVSQNLIIVFPRLYLSRSTVARSVQAQFNTSIVSLNPQNTISSPYSHVQANQSPSIQFSQTIRTSIKSAYQIIIGADQRRIKI